MSNDHHHHQDPAVTAPTPPTASATPRRCEEDGCVAIEHQGQRPVPAPGTDLHRAADLPLELAIVTAIDRAGKLGTCTHPDPGGPIYDSDRVCANCAATAVMELFHSAHVLHLFRHRLAAVGQAAVGRWAPGYGLVPAGDPRADEWWQRPASSPLTAPTPTTESSSPS